MTTAVTTTDKAYGSLKEKARRITDTDVQFRLGIKHSKSEMEMERFNVTPLLSLTIAAALCDRLKFGFLANDHRNDGVPRPRQS